jgi:hypothetical protein
MNVYDLVGALGAAAILAAFAGVQTGRLSPHRPTALWLNLIGASLVMVSLIGYWNLATFLLEVAWIAVALYGLGKLVLDKRRGNVP